MSATSKRKLAARSVMFRSAQKEKLTSSCKKEKQGEGRRVLLFSFLWGWQALGSCGIIGTANRRRGVKGWAF